MSSCLTLVKYNERTGTNIYASAFSVQTENAIHGVVWINKVYCNVAQFTSKSVLQGCDNCHCDPRGTNNRTLVCLKDSGQCNCKKYVQGRKCNACKGNTFGLSFMLTDGCETCNCDPQGMSSSNCSCLIALIGYLIYICIWKITLTSLQIIK